MAETYHAITSVEVWGEPCACIDLDTERREKERDASYIWERSVPLTTSPASSQLYIYMQLVLQ